MGNYAARGFNRDRETHTRNSLDVTTQAAREEKTSPERIRRVKAKRQQRLARAEEFKKQAALETELQERFNPAANSSTITEAASTRPSYMELPLTVNETSMISQPEIVWLTSIAMATGAKITRIDDKNLVLGGSQAEIREAQNLILKNLGRKPAETRPAPV